MNRSMNIMAVQRILQEFERESSAMDMKNDIMNDTIEDAIGTEDDALGENIGENEESEAILRQVLDEIGVDISQQVCDCTTDPSSVMYRKTRFLLTILTTHQKWLLAKELPTLWAMRIWHCRNVWTVYARLVEETHRIR